MKFCPNDESSVEEKSVSRLEQEFDSMTEEDWVELFAELAKYPPQQTDW